MALEIERKFLVAGPFKQDASSHEEIVQGYLSSVADRTVRVRIKGTKAYLTVKGIGNDSGVARFEWEKEISVTDAHELLKICEPGVISKVRYYISSGNHTFEVDEFNEENKGLIVAEIELTSEDELFDKPEWLGKEVTGDKRYYNAYLAKNPYSQWE